MRLRSVPTPDQMVFIQVKVNLCWNRPIAVRLRPCSGRSQQIRNHPISNEGKINQDRKSCTDTTQTLLSQIFSIGWAAQAALHPALTAYQYVTSWNSPVYQKNPIISSHLLQWRLKWSIRFDLCKRNRTCPTYYMKKSKNRSAIFSGFVRDYFVLRIDTYLKALRCSW